MTINLKGIDFGAAYTAYNEPVLSIDEFEVSVLMFLDESLPLLGITPDHVAQYGQIALSVKLGCDEDNGEDEFPSHMLGRLHEIFDELPKGPNIVAQIFDPYTEHARPCFFVYGYLRLAIGAIIESGLITEKQAIPLFEKIEEEQLIISGKRARFNSEQARHLNAAALAMASLKGQ